MINPKKWQIIILAAGKSTRMNSKKHKSLVKIQGKNLLSWCVDLANKICSNEPLIVWGYDADKIISENSNLNVHWVRQEVLGGGTATTLLTGVRGLDKEIKDILVLYVDDAFLYSPQNIIDLCDEHEKKENVMTLLTFKSKPLQIGGVVNDENGRPVDTMDISQIQTKGITEVDILCGAIALEKTWFENNYEEIKINYKQERGLPELINVAYLQGKNVSSHPLENGSYWQGVNTKKDLQKARYLKLKQIKNNERI